MSFEAFIKGATNASSDIPNDLNRLDMALYLAKDIQPVSHISIEIPAEHTSTRGGLTSWLKDNIIAEMRENGLEAMAERFEEATQDIKSAEPLIILAASYVRLEREASFLDALKEDVEETGAGMLEALDNTGEECDEADSGPKGSFIAGLLGIKKSKGLGITENFAKDMQKKGIAIKATKTESTKTTVGSRLAEKLEKEKGEARRRIAAYSKVDRERLTRNLFDYK